MTNPVLTQDALAKNTLEEGRKALLAKVLKFNAKLHSNQYDFNQVICFCGKDDSVEVVDKDRYGIPYSLHLCKHCGLMFSKNRMTHDSSKRFYQGDYRYIYDHGINIKEDYALSQKAAIKIKEMLSSNDVQYKTVFEIGCNTGGVLSEFQDYDAYGVDYNQHSVESAQKKGLNVFCGGIAELESLNKKADLIMMNHVMEHFEDIETELDNISKLLNKDGYLFMSVPPFYGWDYNLLFQAAHNWQFTVNTLEYVMECCGWTAINVNNEIDSIWRYTGDKRDKNVVFKSEAKDIWGYAFSGKNILPNLNTNCKFSLKDRKDSVKKSLSYKFPDIRGLKNKEKGNQAIVISGAPSVIDYKDKILEMKKNGMVIVSIDRMYKWCLDNNIVPDYVVTIDGHNDVIESFEKINKDTVHIISSICKESVCDLLSEYKTYIYSSQQAGIHFANEWDKHKYKKVTLLNTGSTVSLASIVISTYLGVRDIHMFGFDCHIMNGNYAKGISGKGCIPEEGIVLNIDNREWLTTMPFTAFAQQFFQIYILLKSNNMLNTIKLYGDSLIKAMAKNINIDGDKVNKKGTK